MTVPPATELTDRTVAVRPATVADVEALIAFRAALFQDVGRQSGTQGETWQGACRQLLLDGFAAGDLIGAVGETDDGTIVASGIATLRRWLPSPTNPAGLSGYIGSMATLEPWRCQGIGRRITEALVAALRDRGAVDIEVHATEAAAALYRSLGFVDHHDGTGLTLRTDAG